MNFRVTGLPVEPFRHLFGLSDADLAQLGIERHVADRTPGFPDRIELRDAEPGESVLLLNYLHQPAPTPYRASHAIFVLEGATRPFDRLNEIPPVFHSRMLSLRAFDDGHRMIDADLIDGRQAENLIERMLAKPEVSYVQAHYAKRGCYAARIERG